MEQPSESIQGNGEEQKEENKRNYILPFSIIIAALLISGSFIYTTGLKNMPANKQVFDGGETATASELEKAVLPTDGVVLPVKWGDLGAQMINAGVIDKTKFEGLYEGRGGLDAETQRLLTGLDKGNLKINAQNAGTLLNLLWALGLGNKSSVLDNGPMKDPRYGGAKNFASTAGWTLAKGDAMNYYSRYSFITLTKDEEDLVERVSKNIYRPCCGNSVYFPDCNHGIAMLGLLELMTSQGVSESDMYKYALAVNSYWFPETYLTIAKFMAAKGVSWDKVDAKEVLGVAYSSSAGYQKVLTETTPAEPKSSGGCGV